MRRRLVLIPASLAVVLFVAAAAWLTLPSRPEPIGGAFELTDQDGGRVTEKDLLGKPSVIFFGFTNCPDICPSTLLDVTNWLQTPGIDADKLNVIFVSVDSERDRPEQLKLYLSSFDPHIRGLTGSGAQIRQIASAYRVYYKRVPLDGGYTYDHSAFIYLLDRNSRYVGLITYKEPAASVAAKLRALVSGG
jgi:protein SCO1